MIVPIGPLILKRRYGFIRPGFTNQITSFSSLIFYQLLVLTPVSRMTKANLNFTLCHSDADFLFSSLGYHYYMAGVVNLNFLSFICRWITYLTVTLIYKVKDVLMKTVKGGKKQNWSLFINLVLFHRILIHFVIILQVRRIQYYSSYRFENLIIYLQYGKYKQSLIYQKIPDTLWLLGYIRFFKCSSFVFTTSTS